jgi:hypothetical protein
MAIATTVLEAMRTNNRHRIDLTGNRSPSLGAFLAAAATGAGVEPRGGARVARYQADARPPR